MVVDDETVARTSVRVNLESDGFQVGEACDGQRAKELARAARPDLILLDVRMPGKDGLQILEEIQADPQLRGIPIVMLTADAQESSEWRARDLGAIAYIAKPVDPDDLLRVVRRVLEMPRN